MDIYCVKTKAGFVAAHDSDYELMKRFKDGEVVKLRATKPRNYEFLKKYWALVKITYDNLPEPLMEKWNINSIEAMHKRFKYDLGYFTSTIGDKKERILEYISISFAAMEECDFQNFYNECVRLICRKYIRGLERHDLEEMIERFM